MASQGKTYVSQEKLLKMRKFTLAAGLAVAVLVPSLALAQSSCEQQSGNRAAGTVVGAGLGALVGSAIAGRGNHTTGAIVGGVGGAVIGNSIGGSSADCAHAYGYYDRDSQWHATRVSREVAAGYYDRDGRWVEGQPQGYYDSDRNWHTGPASGYYDSNGGWIVTAPGARSYEANYSNRRGQANALRELESRENWLDSRIHAASDNRSMGHGQARGAIAELNSIRRSQEEMRRSDGRFSPSEERELRERLDRLGASVGVAERDYPNG